MTSTRRQILGEYLDGCRDLVLEQIRHIVPREEGVQPILYQLMLDYPLREAKGLRPALCIATCRALGGRLDVVLQSAAVLELYHNAFLVHDDVEDESWLRRGRPTLHREHGVPIAVHVGDAMLAMTLQPLLENMRSIGLGPALRILDAIAQMTRETVHGQALELDWVRHCRWDLSDEDYLRMVELKTGYYSFIAPVAVGAITARAPEARLVPLRAFARALGIAFQIQDDILNLRGEEGTYGKEIDGDLWEGKRTLMLLHAVRHLGSIERSEAVRILSLPRPPPPDTEGDGPIGNTLRTVGALEAEGSLSRAGAVRLREALAFRAAPCKSEDDVRWLRAQIDRHGSIDHAARVARTWAEEARTHLEACEAWLPPSIHRDVLTGLVEYVVERVR